MKNNKEKIKNQLEKYLKKIKNFLLDIIFTVKCPYCGKVIERTESSCKECRKKFPSNCISAIAVGDYQTVAPFPYEDIFSNAVKQFKFYGNPSYSKALSFELANTILKKYDIDKIDFITFVPMHKDSFKQRHFNQAELLARGCADILDIPCKNVLEKYKKNKTQHSLKGKERLENVRGVYRVTNENEVKGKSILIIDDIITTGNTLGECCRVLKKQGCSNVVCATLCAVILE